MYDTLYVILNKSENATLQYFIFFEKVLDEKYLLKINNVFQTSSKRFVKLHQFVYFDVWLCLKIYSLNFAIAQAQKKIVMLIRFRHTCVALLHKKTVLSLETSSEINFEFIKFVKKGKCLPLTKTNREYYINIGDSRKYHPEECIITFPEMIFSTITQSENVILFYYTEY